MSENTEAQLAKLEAERKKRLEALNDIDAQMAQIRAANREAKLLEIKKFIADYGFKATDFFEAVPALTTQKKSVKTKSKTALIVKYRDENGNTWHGGKGPNPKWVKAIKEAGGDIEKYLVTN